MLSVLVTLSLAFRPLPASQDPDVIRQVREILDQHCGSFPEERRAEWAWRIASALSLAPQGRIVKLLDGLPQLAKYCESTVSFYRDQLSSSEVHDRLIAQGYEIFGDQVEIIVKRGATRDEPGSHRAPVEEQIRAIVGSARELLKDRIVGAAAAHYIDGEMDRLETGLKSTLDLPYGCVMDSPLSAPDLERVLGDLRKATQSFDRIMVEEKDLGNPKRLADIGVARLIADVSGAAYTVGKLCFPERSESVRRENAWIREIKAAQAKERQLSQERLPEERPLKEETQEPDRKKDPSVQTETALPGDSAPGPTSKVGATESRGGTRGDDASRKVDEGHGRFLLASVGLALLVVLIWVLSRSRGR